VIPPIVEGIREIELAALQGLRRVYGQLSDAELDALLFLTGFDRKDIEREQV